MDGQTVASSTYQKVKSDIIFGRLQPETKLKLETLRTRYAASLSTIREILNRLASEGFVSIEEQRGFFVSAVSRQDLVEIANLRVLLECSALKTSVETGDADWEGNLVAARHKLLLMEKRMLSGDDSVKETWKQYDAEFHLAMIHACNSKNLLELHSLLYEKYLRYQMLILTYRGAEAVDEHQDMFDAALARDATRAQQLLKKHIMQGLEHTLAFAQLG